jgi:hypothetical protein
MSDHAVPVIDRGFALLIAFLLPGLVALFGIATVNPTVLGWFQGAQSGPQLVGFLFVLMAALALNIVIHALRWFVFEKVRIAALGCPWVKPNPPLDLRNRKDLEAQYIDNRHQFYYHYLAYGNSAVAIPIAVTAWKFGSHAPEPPMGLFLSVCGGAAVLTAVLGLAACEAICRYMDRQTSLLGLRTPTPPTPVNGTATSTS